ncbi:MAG: hypothetical protein R3F05_02280 [Planctomycetota bacterium]
MQAGKTTRREKRAIGRHGGGQGVPAPPQGLPGRCDGTIDHDGDKLYPLVDAWDDTPLARWSRSMPRWILSDRDWAAYCVRNALGVYRRFVKWCDAVAAFLRGLRGGLQAPRAHAR